VFVRIRTSHAKSPRTHSGVFGAGVLGVEIPDADARPDCVGGVTGCRPSGMVTTARVSARLIGMSIDTPATSPAPVSGPAGALSAPVIAALAAVWIVWGSTYLAIKIGLETMPPFFMQGTRFVFASAIMLTVLRRRSVPWPTKVQIRHAAMIGIVLLIGGLGFVTLAEDRGVDTGLVATIIAIQPMMMSLWGGLWRQWPLRLEWVGMVIGLGGVVILMSDDGLSGSWNGISLVFIACVCWSFGSALSRRIDMPDGFMTTAIEMAAAAVAYMLLSLVRREQIEVPSLRSSLAVAYLVIFGSIIAFTAFTYLISHVSGPLAMSYAYINPAIAVLLGVTLSNEVLSANMAVALPVILVGVAMVTNASRRRQTT
jgi:drug/metabolite transporter (DMT)-like permease